MDMSASVCWPPLMYEQAAWAAPWASRGFTLAGWRMSVLTPKPRAGPLWMAGQLNKEIEMRVDPCCFPEMPALPVREVATD